MSALLWLYFLRLLASFVDLPLLAGSFETSSANLLFRVSSLLWFLLRCWFLFLQSLISLSGVGFGGPCLLGETFLSSAAESFSDHGGVPLGVGCFPPPPSFFGPLVSGSCSGSLHFFGPQSSFPGSLGFRGCGSGSVRSFSLGHLDCGRFHRSSGRFTFPVSLSTGFGSLGVVSSSSDSPLRFLLPGRKFLLSIFLSRGKLNLPSVWDLKSSVFQRFCLVVSPPPPLRRLICLRLSSFSQLPKFYARFRDPLAWKVDAMSFCWSGLHLFSFPRSPCFPEFWRRFSQDGVEVALVAPFWPQRLCFPCLSWPVFLGLCLARRFFWGNPSLSCLSLGAKVYIFHSDRFQASWKGGRPFCQSS